MAFETQRHGTRASRICARARTRARARACGSPPRLPTSLVRTAVCRAAGTQTIPNTIVKEGGGVGWALNPIPMPNFVGSTCDRGNGPSQRLVVGDASFRS